MPRRASKIRLSLAAPSALLALLAVLATIQYRWIGKVSEAERERMASAARAAAEGVARDFEIEIGRVFHHFAPSSRDSGEGPVLADAAKHWAAESRFPLLVEDVFVARGSGGGETGLERLDLSSGRLEAVPWPLELSAVRRSIEEGERSLAGKDEPLHDGFGDPARKPPRRPMPHMLDEIPALILPIEAARGSGRAAPGESPVDRWAIVRLDQAAIRTRVLPELVRQHFGTSGEYDVAVVLGSDPRVLLYRSRASFSPEKVRQPDAEIVLLSGPPRFEGPDRGGRASRSGENPGPRRERLGPFSPRAPGHGGWRLLAVHRAGSLQAAVDATRRRNLAVSGAILLLLAATFAVLIHSAQRAQRLARQQVEFVAGLTHELRTPLAAIRSAGQNLADGVVADRERVRQYGRLLEREGRRLSELIEDALAHAGIVARRPGLRDSRVEIGAILEEAIAACRPLAQENGTSVERSSRPICRLSPATRPRCERSWRISSPTRSSTAVGRDPSRSRRGPANAQSTSRFEIEAPASPLAICPGSSSPSTAAAASPPEGSPARDSAFRSSGASPRPTAGA